MKSKLSFLFEILLLCCIFEELLAYQTCNEYVDDVLKDIKANKEYFTEPYEIPENERSFGAYEVEHGYIYGLSTLHRLDNVITMKSKKNSHLKVNLAAGEISIKSSIKRKFLNFGKSANVDVTISLIEMTLDIIPKADGSEPTIHNFKINQVKGLDVKVSGSGLIKDFLLNAFISLVGRFFQNAVKNAVEEKLKRFLKNKVLDYTIPPECMNNAWEYLSFY